MNENPIKIFRWNFISVLPTKLETAVQRPHSLNPWRGRQKCQQWTWARWRPLVLLRPWQCLKIETIFVDFRQFQCKWPATMDSGVLKMHNFIWTKHGETESNAQDITHFCWPCSSTFRWNWIVCAFAKSYQEMQWRNSWPLSSHTANQHILRIQSRSVRCMHQLVKYWTRISQARSHCAHWIGLVATIELRSDQHWQNDSQLFQMFSFYILDLKLDTSCVWHNQFYLCLSEIILNIYSNRIGFWTSNSKNQMSNVS